MLILALALTASLTACGGGKTEEPAKAEEPAKTEEPTEPPAETAPEGVDVSTLNGFLSQFGLTEEDIKPAEGFGSFDYTVTEEKSDQGVVKVNMEWPAGADQKAVMSAWVHQVYDRTLAVSDDGKAYTPYTTEVYTLSDGQLPGGGLGTQWARRYQETSNWLTVGAEGGSFAYLELCFN